MPEVTELVKFGEQMKCGIKTCDTVIAVDDKYYRLFTRNPTKVEFTCEHCKDAFLILR